MIGLTMLGQIGQFAGNFAGAQARAEEAKDQLRALRMQKGATIGLSQARSGASGVGGDSASTLDYLRGLGAEFDRSIMTAEKSAYYRYIADMLGAGSSAVGGIAAGAQQQGVLDNWSRG